MNLLRLLAVLAVSVLALAVSGCGEEETLDVVEGEPVELGELEYNVLFTRYLNPGDVEDAEYLEGQPPPPPNTLYLGVFVQVENLDEDHEALLPAHFTIIDTDENVYDAIPSPSAYALEPGTEIEPGGEVPDRRLHRPGRSDRGLAAPLPDRRRDAGEAPPQADRPRPRWPGPDRTRHLSRPRS